MSVGTLGGSSAEHCALPVATRGESRMGWLTDLAATVLATAAEEDARERVGEGEEQSGGGGR